MYTKIKRILDFLVSLVAIIVLSPIFIFIIIAIHLESKGSSIFKQKRIGKNDKHFNMYKFRTMRLDTPKDTPTHLLQDPTKYITKIGKILRKTSLDELPQLINILKGDMSIVGPRPALWNQYDLISARDKNKSNTILPGLTGFAQISGRDELPIPIKAKLDGQYLDKMSFLFDIKIIFLTIKAVLVADGVREGVCNENTNNRIE